MATRIPGVDPDQHPRDPDHCRRCELYRDATQAVPGSGTRRARVMLVGEQPSNDEDLVGKPFVGPAGKLLDRALADAGLARRDVFLTNAVKHFRFELRGKRRLHKTPAQRHVDACRYWLLQELTRVQPAVIVTLGATALKAVMDAPLTLAACSGRDLDLDLDGTPVVATWHPSAALRVPDPAERARLFEAIVAAFKRAVRLAGR